MPDKHDSAPTDTIVNEISTRRGFIKRAAVTAIAGGAVAACKDGAPKAQAAVATATPASTPVVSALSAAETMDKMHEAGIKAFPAKTAGKGNQPFAPRIEKGVKVYELTAEKIQWETAPGQKVEAWAYNGQVPGPQIRVREGDRVRVILHNKLEQSTSIHFHGLELPNEVDGVPFITQPPVKAGTSYTYEFTVPEGNFGSHMYHSHHNAAQQVGLGLLGAFLVEPRNPSELERADVDYTLIMNDGAHGYTFNGKSFPATEPLTAKVGQKLRIRFMNEGMMIHPMHLHGMHMTVFAKDGWTLPAPWKCDTLNVAPGERYDVMVKCKAPGTWAFHCHILPHAESEHGMFGMVTALIVS
jgi:FtsP/CotA-like multicopper oxidase with cupredoxin domain